MSQFQLGNLIPHLQASIILKYIKDTLMTGLPDLKFFLMILVRNLNQCRMGVTMPLKNDVKKYEI